MPASTVATVEMAQKSARVIMVLNPLVWKGNAVNLATSLFVEAGFKLKFTAAKSEGHVCIFNLEVSDNKWIKHLIFI